MSWVTCRHHMSMSSMSVFSPPPPPFCHGLQNFQCFSSISQVTKQLPTPVCVCVGIVFASEPRESRTVMNSSISTMFWETGDSRNPQETCWWVAAMVCWCLLFPCFGMKSGKGTTWPQEIWITSPHDLPFLESASPCHTCMIFSVFKEPLGTCVSLPECFSDSGHVEHIYGNHVVSHHQVDGFKPLEKYESQMVKSSQNSENMCLKPPIFGIRVVKSCDFFPGEHGSNHTDFDRSSHPQANVATGSRSQRGRPRSWKLRHFRNGKKLIYVMQHVGNLKYVYIYIRVYIYWQLNIDSKIKK